MAQDTKAFARRLKELAASLGESQTDMAIRLGYRQPRVSQVMRGEGPSREFVERLIEEYALDREEWLGLAGYGERPPNLDELRFREVAAMAIEAGLRCVDDSARRARWFAEEVRKLQARYPRAGRAVPNVMDASEDEMADALRLLEEWMKETEGND